MSRRGRLVAAFLLLGLLGWIGGEAFTGVVGTRPVGQPTTITEPADVVAAARRALTAWGRFAVTGDLAALDGSFDPGGPQYRVLRGESDALRDAPLGAPPYSFDLVVDDVVADGRYNNVEASVAMTRPGEKPQSFDWTIVMRRSGDRWLLWTVVD